MKTYLATIVHIIFLFNSLVAQGPDLLKSTGKIPLEFISPSSSKYNKQVKALKGKKKGKSDEKQFLLESNFEIDNILQSGLVLFNDPASVYVNKVLDQLPNKHRSRKKSKPRVYILNSPAVNAFATDQGIIFVTLGLLAKLENEAQLAFILSHELIHFHHNHAINKFVHSKNIKRNKKSFNFDQNKDNLTLNNKLFQESLYSRKIEEEADEEGFEIFKKTGYDASSIPDVFKILYYAYLPFENEVFERSFFEDEKYIFPNNRWLKEILKIEPMVEKEDEQSSHPASAKRLNKIQASINKEKLENKKIFLVGEKEFNNIKNKARYQIPFLNMYNGNYPEAIYTAYLQLKTQEDDLELKKLIGKCLYMHAKFSNYGENWDVSMQTTFRKITKEIQGESQQVYNLLAEMDHKESTILALRYNWDLYKNNKKDEELNTIIDDLFVEFASNFKDLKIFSVKAKTKNEISNKKDSNKKKKFKSKRVDYWNHAFVSEVNNQDFINHYKAGKKKYNQNKKETDDFKSSDGQRQYQKERKREFRKGKTLGIKKIVVVNPYYLSVTQKNNGEERVEYIRTEEKQKFFSKELLSLAKKKKIKAQILDVNKLNSNDIQVFNDIATANLYFTQQMDQYNLSLTPGYQQNEMDKLAKKYNTDYFLWTGVISMQSKNMAEWYLLAGSLLFPYALPYTIKNVATPNYDTFYFAFLYDVKTGRRSVLKTDFYNKRDGKALLKAHMYDVYHQIKTKGKRKR